jgi:hypothetical protein
MADKKHPYCNEVVFTSRSGDTGEPLNEIIWRQYYDNKVTQIEEQQKVVPAVIAGITGAVMPRAESDLRKLKGDSNINTR